MNPQTLFTNLVVSGKLGLILVFIVFSIINGNVEYVKERPRIFMLDSIITGLVGALAAILLAFTRGRPDLWINHAVFALLLFFFYNVAREFMGYFSVLSDRPRTKALELQYKILKYPALILVGVFTAVMIGLAFINRVPPDFSGGALSHLSAPLAFLAETVMMTTVLSAGEVLVLANHGENDIAFKLLESLVLFTGTHVVLQFGGFYKILYA